MKFLKLLCTLFLLFTITACGSDNDTSFSNSAANDSNNSTNNTVYKVYFNGNNGDGYMIPLEFKNGESKQLTKNDFSRGGFVFKGWATSSDGSVVYTDMQTVSFTHDIELFAVWEAVKVFSITLHSNNTKNEKIIVEYPANIMPVKLPYNTFQNGSNKFTGWKSSDNKISYIDGCDVVYLNGDLDLYASWNIDPVSITFDPLGGKGKMPIIYAMPGDLIKLPKASFTKVGYELKETYTYDIYTYGFGSDFKVPSSDVILYANWLKLPEPEVPTFGGNSKKYRNEYVFVNGVKMLESDWIESSSKGIYYGIWKDYAGWYDVYQGSFNLCWAASSSNIIHWWYDRNKANIEKYYAYYAPEDIVKPDFFYHGNGKSDIFDLYKEKWRDGGWYVDNGLEWFFVGTHYNTNGGGYFKDIFENNFSDIVEEYYGLNQYLLNTYVEKALDNGMAISLGERNAFGPHAITLWGVHFDDEGYVDGIFVSDSGTKPGNNAPNKEETGLLYMNIEYDEYGKVYATNVYNAKVPLTRITIFSDGKEQWESYFKSNKKLR